MFQGRRAGLFIFFGVWIWMLSGCGKQDRSLVQIGPKDRITVSQFKKNFDITMEADYRRELPDSIPLEKFQRHLEGMIENRLIVLSAYEAGLDQDSTIQEKVQKDLPEKMLNQLYSDKVIDVAVTENDIRNFWVRSGIEVSCRKIEIHYPPKRDSIADEAQHQKARDVLARARKGEAFSRLARQYSDDRVTALKGGEISPLWYNASGDPIIEAAFSMREGEISDLIEIPKGWAILCVDKTDEKNKKTFTAAHDGIRDYLAGQKKTKLNAIAKDYLTSLDKKYDVVVHDTVLDTLASCVKRWKAKSERPNLLDSLKALPEDFRSKTLLVNKQQNIRVSDLITVFEGNPRLLYRGRFEEGVAIKEFLYNQFRIQLKMLEQEAHRLGYEKNTRVIEKTRRTQESEMVSLYLNRYVYARYETDTNAVRDYYQAHIADKYSTPEKVRVQEVQIYGQQKVDQVLDRAKRGADFGKLASELTMRSGYKDKKGILPDISKGTWGEVGAKAFEMKAGELAVVKVGENKFSVIKLLQKIPAQPKPFKQVASDAERACAKEIFEQKKTDWLNTQREARGVFINEKVLEDLWRSYQKPHEKS